MKKFFTFLAGIFVSALLTSGASAQSQPIDSATTLDQFSETYVSATVSSSGKAVLLPAEIAQKIAEAKQLLRARSAISATLVTLAALDTETSQINLFSLLKDSFLIVGSDLEATTQLGRSVRLRVINANGVNTSVSVKDATSGKQLVPLVVQYPIVKDGTITETAYYTSAHPALMSTDVATAGNTYVTSMLETAAQRLASDGQKISPEIINVAEHLVIVEHTDHKRFLNEDRGKIYPEVLTLYARNQGDTFRYSVSSAGAGGMIQMIPRTYAGIKQQHPTANLKSDFVDGMRDHANALQAMLLYINDTWNYLQKNDEVQDALRNGTATKAELLAAGYNSNPMRLPAYLKNGGARWRTLIPAETQMYLAIYKSVDGNVQFKNDGSPESLAQVALPSAELGEFAASRGIGVMVLTWLSKELEVSTQLLVSRRW